jgi:hypothetical protein
MSNAPINQIRQYQNRYNDDDIHVLSFPARLPGLTSTGICDRNRFSAVDRWPAGKTGHTGRPFCGLFPLRLTASRNTSCQFAYLRHVAQDG